MYYIRVKADPTRRWKVREAISVREAYNAIIMAMVSGSVGSKHTQTVQTGESWKTAADATKVLADVVQVNSDLTERKPYSRSY